jgi:hypothetical protein
MSRPVAFALECWQLRLLVLIPDKGTPLLAKQVAVSPKASNGTGTTKITLTPMR